MSNETEILALNRAGSASPARARAAVKVSVPAKKKSPAKKKTVVKKKKK